MNQRADPGSFRQAIGRFATGVAVVTARARDGMPIGMTINSFSSVSLEPPLVLWSLSRCSSRFDDFVAASHFAINVLGADQEAVSSRFAGPRAHRFEGIDWLSGEGGVPLLPRRGLPDGSFRLISPACSTGSSCLQILSLSWH